MNSRAITEKKAPSLSFLFLANLILAGCIFPSMWGRPGYLVRIETILSSEDDLRSIQQLVTDRKFSLYPPREQPSNEVHYITYTKEVPEAKSYITIGLRYKSIVGTKGRIQFGMMIGNDWTGKERLIKKQIDELGDFFYGLLVEKTGKENVKIDRRATGPPF